MKKRILSLFLALALLCGLLPQMGLLAHAESYSGTCGAEGDGSNLTWTLDTNTGLLSIEGSGEMRGAAAPEYAPWYDYREMVTAINLPEGLTKIGILSFSYFTSLTSLSIPESLTTIDEAAFYGCTALTSMTIPKNVTKIGYDAFYGCTALTSIHVASDNPYYSSIDGVLFNKAETDLEVFPAGKATSYAIPDGVTCIGNDAFSGCVALADITIPDSVSYIGIHAFFGCSSLTSVTIPANVESINWEAFGYFMNNGTKDKIDGFTIYGYNGTAAQTYAEENGFTFVPLVNAPVITGQPDSAEVALGTAVSFSVVATGGELSYKWQYKKPGSSTWKNWSGKTAATVTVKASNANNGYQYRCIVSNAAGSVTSEAASLTLTASAAKPVITGQPASVSVALGQTASFSVVATGENLSYKWQYKKPGSSTWVTWSGKTAATVTVKASNANNGWQYRCIVSNSAGSVSSEAAALTVGAAANGIRTEAA
ncbi:MAG: leucine-rich repeat protein [Oscillospiraceae bacterium]|nr:leucine-rich repeat protein [Oscillospiraceae bacterium]